MSFSWRMVFGASWLASIMSVSILAVSAARAEWIPQADFLGDPSPMKDKVYPWTSIGHLALKRPSGKVHPFCTGTLVKHADTWFVISAAHCFGDLTPDLRQMLVFARFQVGQIVLEVSDVEIVWLGVDKPDGNTWSPSEHSKDVAILRVKSKMPKDAQGIPIYGMDQIQDRQIDFDHLEKHRRWFSSVGYSDYGQYGSATAVIDNNCSILGRTFRARHRPTDEKVIEFSISSSNVGYPKFGGNNFYTACEFLPGMSGGPLLFFINGIWKIVGINTMLIGPKVDGEVIQTIGLTLVLKGQEALKHFLVTGSPL